MQIAENGVAAPSARTSAHGHGKRNRAQLFLSTPMASPAAQGCSVLMIWAVAVIGVQRQPPWPVGGLGFA